MKKRFWGFALAAAAGLTTAICLSACGGGTKGVSLHNKTYTLGTEITWSYYTKDVNNVKITVSDPVTYLTENWSTVIDSSSFPAGCQNAQQVIDALKAKVEDPSDNSGDILLKGAVITIGKENKVDANKCESTFECKMDNQSVAYFPKIYTSTLHSGTISKSRYTAVFEGSAQSEFKLTDYNESTKAINNIYTRLCVTKTSPSTGTQNVFYSNVSAVELYRGSSPAFVVEGRVDLVSVR